MSLHRYDFQDNLDAAKAELANNYEWSRNMKEWLIERIEELEEILLQTNYDAALLEKRTEELLKLNEQNKRYRETIEEAIEYANSPKILTSPAEIEKILSKALEGDNE